MSELLYEVDGKFIVIRHDNQVFKSQLRGARPHNDHVLLAAVMAFNGIKIKQTEPINVMFPVSRRVRECLESSNYPLNFKNGNVDEYVGSVPGLSYSAGVDSTAAAIIMGGGVAIYMSRGMRFDRFAVEAIKSLRKQGWQAYTAFSDVEHLRTPIGFPTDLSCATSLIINANHFGIDSVATGTILESAYGIGRRRYRDYKKSSHFKHWSKLFLAAGLPLNFVTAGLSEVATFDIYNRSEGYKAKSCLRDTFEYCKQCYKCFRRFLIQGIALPNADRFSSMIRKKHHIDILDYAYEKHGIKTCSDQKARDLLCLERWYPKSSEVMFEKYRTQVVESMPVDAMSESEVARIERYQA